VSKPANGSPNVIVFFTDQQRWDSTGLGGNPLGLTPNFDRIAQANTYLSRNFTCQPVCSPARSCLQTGQYATTTGVWRNGRRLNPESTTLAKCFNAAGYRTGYIGKWHLSAPETPKYRGPVPREFRGGYQDWLAAESVEGTSDVFATRLWNENEELVELPGYRVDAMTDAAIRYVDARNRESQPFFLFLSLLEPHHQNHVDAYPAPDGYREQYQGRWTPPDLAALPAWNFNGDDPNRHTIGGTAQMHLGGYWGMVKRIDEAFGRLMDALKSLQIDQNTIVLFTSDHGCHFKTRNSEYKRSCHESSIRVPGLIAGPGFVGGGSVPQLVNLVDLPPTLLDAAGVKVPETMEGRSIMPLVRRESREWPDDIFVQISESHNGRAVRTQRWKYAVESTGNKIAARSDSYTEAFLYDLEHDPYELCNLIGSKPHESVKAVMRERLLRWIKQVEKHEPTILLAPDHPVGQRTVSEAETRM